MAQQVSTNTFGVAKWIVSPDPTQGTHTTIAGALASASSGDTIYVRDGTYVEDITGKDGVYLIAVASDQALLPGSTNYGNSILNGKISFTSGTFKVENLVLQTNADYVLEVTGAAVSRVELIGCFLNATNNSLINFTSSNASSTINLTNCSGDLATTGIKIWTMSSPGSLYIDTCNFSNSGLSVSQSSNSDGVVNFYRSSFASPVECNGTGGIGGFYSGITCINPDTVALGIDGTGSCEVSYCRFFTSTAVPISINNGCILAMTGTNVVSTVSGGSIAIQGVGTGAVRYTNIACTGTATSITASKAPLPIYVGSGLAFSDVGPVTYEIQSLGGVGNSGYYKASTVSGPNSFAWGYQGSNDKFSMAYNGDGTLEGGVEWFNFDPALTLGTFHFDTTVEEKLEFQKGLIANVITTSGAGPHIITTDNYFIAVDTSAVAPTVQFPNAPATGQKFIIKDASGNAGTNNITVTTPGGTVTFDGLTSFTMNTNYRSISLIFDGSNYLIW